MLEQRASLIYMLVLLLSSLSSQSPRFGSNETFSRNAEERTRHPESNNETNCKMLKVITHEEYDNCTLRIWDRNGTVIHDTKGNGEYQMCYNATRCYYIEMISDLYCSFDVVDNSKELDTVTLKDDQNIIRVGDCSTPLCGDNAELFMTTDDAPSSFTHHVANKDQIPSNDQSSALAMAESETSQLRNSNQSAHICVNMNQCNIVTASEGGTIYYYLFDGGYLSRTGRFYTDAPAVIGNCTKNKILLIQAHDTGFSYKQFINNELTEARNMTKGDVIVMPIDFDKCNTINGTGNATYTLYHQNGTLYNNADYYSNYYSFGKCSCGYKSLYLSSSARGKDIMTLLSSVWGMEVFNDVQSPQYTSACWIINYDLLQLNANDTNIIQRYIMALLFYSTDGWNWRYGYSFLSGMHECQWNSDAQGIDCRDDSVTDIDLCKLQLQNEPQN